MLGVDVSMVGWGVELTLEPGTVPLPFELFPATGGCFLSS